MTIWENGKVREVTKEELKFIQEEPPIEYKIAELKQNLADTDYQSLKHHEGDLTDEEFEPIRLQRKVWRDEINRLEKENE